MVKSVLYKDVPVFYRVEGEGKPVVLVHGVAEDGSIWNKQIEFLHNRYQFIVPDLPGSGLSPNNGNQHMEELANAVKAILDHEHIADAVVVGHSMGGYVTLALAENNPERLTALGLFHSSAFADTEEKKKMRQKNITFIRTHGSLAFLQQSTPTLFSDEFKTAYPELVADVVERYKNFNPESMAAYHKAMMLRPDRTGTLQKFMRPVLFIIGRHDNAIPFNDSLRQCHLPVLSYIHVLDKSGHMAMMEEQQKSNELLEKFFKDVYANTYINS